MKRQSFEDSLNLRQSQSDILKRRARHVRVVAELLEQEALEADRVEHGRQRRLRARWPLGGEKPAVTGASGKSTKP